MAKQIENQIPPFEGDRKKPVTLPETATQVVNGVAYVGESPADMVQVVNGAPVRMVVHK